MLVLVTQINKIANIYIYIYRERERERERVDYWPYMPCAFIFRTLVSWDCTKFLLFSVRHGN